LRTFNLRRTCAPSPVPHSLFLILPIIISIFFSTTPLPTLLISKPLEPYILSLLFLRYSGGLFISCFSLVNALYLVAKISILFGLLFLDRDNLEIVYLAFCSLLLLFLYSWSDATSQDGI